MRSSIQLKVGQRGVLTLPKDLRDRYHVKTGDDLTLLDLDGVFILSTRRSEIDTLSDRVAEELARKGESLDSMLATVREERERYGRP